MTTAGIQTTRSGTPSFARRLSASVTLTCYAVYAYVLLEWLFVFTKPSFLDSFDLATAVRCLLVPPLVASILAIPVTTSLVVLDRCLLPRTGWGTLAVAVPAVILGALGFLLVDNFRYTMTGNGVINSTGPERWALLFLLVATCLGMSLYLRPRFRRMAEAPLSSFHRRAVGSLVALSTTGALAAIAMASPEASDVEIVPISVPISRPNVVLVSLDGVEADFLSAYGYSIPTSPYLARLASESLLFENALPNVGKTTGSTTSMLTGRSPEILRVGMPPQVLRSEDSYRNLPAMLRKVGYRTWQRSVRYYADAVDLGMEGGFEVANGRRPWSPVAGTPAAMVKQAFHAEGMMLHEVGERIVTRVLHVARVRPMLNHFLLVNNGEGRGLAADKESVEEALEFARASESPYFLHFHVMSTHVGVRPPALRFDVSELPPRPGLLPASGQAESLAVLTSIRDADDLLERLVEGLREQDGLANTLVIICADHSRNWGTDRRVPLIVRLPGTSLRARVSRNVQLLDVAATVLDVMGLAPPPWMDSRSLLRARPSEPDSELPAPLPGGSPAIGSLARFKFAQFPFRHSRDDEQAEVGGVLVRLGAPGPPWFGVASYGVVICSRQFLVSLRTGAVEEREIVGHTAPCPEESYPPQTAVRAWARRRLQEGGFGVSF